MDSQNDSPILNQMLETLNGNVTVRAFNRTEYFMNSFLEKVQDKIDSMYTQESIQAWFSLRLNFASASLMSSIGLIFTFAIQFDFLKNVGFLSLAFIEAFTIAGEIS